MRTKLLLPAFGVLILFLHSCQSCKEEMKWFKSVEINCIVDSLYVNEKLRGARIIAVHAISGFQPKYGLDGYELPLLYARAKRGDTIIKELHTLRFVLKKTTGEVLECYPECDGKVHKE